MKSFKEYHSEDQINGFMIEIPVNLIPSDLLINEGSWINSHKSGYMYRVDAENSSIKQQRHIHISKSKHIHSKNMNASWNQDGSKHDKKSFNSKLASIQVVQNIAREVLRLPAYIKLEEVLHTTPNINEATITSPMTQGIYRAFDALNIKE